MYLYYIYIYSIRASCVQAASVISKSFFNCEQLKEPRWAEMHVQNLKEGVGLMGKDLFIQTFMKNGIEALQAVSVERQD